MRIKLNQGISQIAGAAIINMDKPFLSAREDFDASPAVALQEVIADEPETAPRESNYNSCMYITLSSPLLDERNYAAKRLFDILISGVLIVTVMSWVVPLVGLLILLDSRGPIFFIQKRNKKDGRIFNCLKFRSMYVNNYADTMATYENDTRITPLGRLLRRYHIDELPQLFNVFIGDMSVIGPRPHMICDNTMYRGKLKNYDCRHQVKPGITGLAQAMGYHGCAEEPYQINGRLKLDIMYIRQWSLALDMEIILRTLKLVRNK